GSFRGRGICPEDAIRSAIPPKSPKSRTREAPNGYPGPLSSKPCRLAAAESRDEHDERPCEKQEERAGADERRDDDSTQVVRVCDCRQTLRCPGSRNEVVDLLRRDADGQRLDRLRAVPVDLDLCGVGARRQQLAERERVVDRGVRKDGVHPEAD